MLCVICLALVCLINVFSRNGEVQNLVLDLFFGLVTNIMVGSQTANLTPGLSFGHNLCFKCPNESCEPILNIYVLISFQ
jgi:hypothetical protein